MSARPRSALRRQRGAVGKVGALDAVGALLTVPHVLRSSVTKGSTADHKCEPGDPDTPTLHPPVCETGVIRAACAAGFLRVNQVHGSTRSR